MNSQPNQPSNSSPLLARRLLKINAVIAAFVLLANGSALIFGLSGKAPEVLDDLPSIFALLVGALAILAMALLALAKPTYIQRALTFHAAALSVGALALAMWGVSLAIQPERVLVSSVKTTWSVGWLTALATYAAYLVVQTFLKDFRSTSIVGKYAYVWVGVIAFILDVFIFMQLARPLLSRS